MLNILTSILFRFVTSRELFNFVLRILGELAKKTDTPIDDDCVDFVKQYGNKYFGSR